MDLVIAVRTLTVLRSRRRDGAEVSSRLDVVVDTAASHRGRQWARFLFARILERHAVLAGRALAVRRAVDRRREALPVEVLGIGRRTLPADRAVGELLGHDTRRRRRRLRADRVSDRLAIRVEALRALFVGV